MCCSYLVIVIHRLHRWLAHPLEHEGVAEGDGEHRQKVDGYELVQDESPFMCFRGEPLHAVLTWPVPVAFLYFLIQKYWSREDKRTWTKKKTTNGLV